MKGFWFIIVSLFIVLFNSSYAQSIPDDTKQYYIISGDEFIHPKDVIKENPIEDQLNLQGEFSMGWYLSLIHI